MRPLLKSRHLAEAQLVQDAAWVLVAEVVAARPLPEAEGHQRGARQLGGERQRLQAGEDAVAPEHRHEPRQPGGRQVVTRQRERREPQRRQIDEGALVGPLERVPVAVEAGRIVEPLLEAELHVGACLLRVTLVLERSTGRAAHVPPDRHMQVGRPLLVGLHVDREGEAALVHGACLRGRDPGLAHVSLAAIPEHQPPVVDAGEVLALLLEVVLDLEEVGKVAGGLDAHLEVDRLVVVIEDRELLVKAAADGTLTDDRQLGVDVHGPRAGHEEEARLEVLQVVHREGVEALAVDRQDPAREEPGVEREQPRRIGQRGLDVAAVVADHEGVAVEDLHGAAHDCRSA